MERAEMQFDSLSEFLYMGGHGLYVWLSYGVGVVLIGYNLVAPRIRYRQFQAQLVRLGRREQEIP
jgi:heme exporter protein D